MVTLKGSPKGIMIMIEDVTSDVAPAELREKLSGNNFKSNGDNFNDNFSNNPDFSAILVNPIQRASTGNIFKSISRLTFVLSIIVLLTTSKLFVTTP